MKPCHLVKAEMHVIFRNAQEVVGLLIYKGYSGKKDFKG